TLRRLIVTQGDTEPASVEQQRHLGRTCPSLYDLRNLFQVNVEEGRHLWAMVYLLQAYFGRDGREEAEALLQRRSGDTDKPRILGAFNEKTPDWLSFFMFSFFTDRDGKYQLASLAESGFDPLSRTCRFMLTEEAHHMFVGESGVGRIVQRTCEIMKQQPHDDPRRYGGLDLQLRLPHRGFHRAIGACAEVRVSPDGRLLSQADWDAHKREWLPTEADQVYVQNLMKPVTEPGKFANWIAPPARGINGQPVDFEYVRLV